MSRRVVDENHRDQGSKDCLSFMPFGSMNVAFGVQKTPVAKGHPR